MKTEARVEFLAARLASGRAAAPPATLWWPRHSSSISWYLLTRSQSSLDGDKARREIEEISDEWCRGVMKLRKNSKKGVLMREHGLLECAWVDAACANNVAMLTDISQLLTENVRNQALLYGSMFKGFPEEEFKSLFSQHISLFAEQAGHRMAESSVKAERCLKDLMENSVSLAALTSEWF